MIYFFFIVCDMTRVNRRFIVTRFQARVRSARGIVWSAQRDTSISATSRRSINARGELDRHNCYNCPVCGIGYWMRTCASVDLCGIEYGLSLSVCLSICLSVSLYLFLSVTHWSHACMMCLIERKDGHSRKQSSQYAQSDVIGCR